MRTIFVRVTDEPSPLYAPVLAEPITSHRPEVGLGGLAVVSPRGE